MRIVKYCNSAHNVYKGSKLLIGNLNKYRSIEKAELLDASEGMFDFVIDISEGVSVPNAWANLIFQGSIGFGNVSSSIRLPGQFSTFIESVDIERIGGAETIFRHARAKISYETLNSFIFCCSNIVGEPEQFKPFNIYDDWWEVGNSNSSIDEFAFKVANLILNQAGLASISDNLTQVPIAAIKKLGINVRHGPVNYRPRELIITKDSPVDFAGLIQSYLDVPFCKPDSFSGEREYRFLFTPVIGNQSLSALDTDLLLDVNSIRAPLH